MSILFVMTGLVLISAPIECYQAHIKTRSRDKYQKIHRSRRHRKSPHTFHSREL